MVSSGFGMGLAKAARLAAIAILLEFGYWVVETVRALRRGPILDTASQHYEVIAMPTFGMTSVASILFLFLLYRSLAGRNNRLALQCCALVACSGSALEVALWFFPPAVVIHITFLSRVFSAALVIRRVCWAALFGIFGVWAKPLTRRSVRVIALVTAVLQAWLGATVSFRLFRMLWRLVTSTYPLYPFPERLGTVLWGSAIPAVFELFYWTTLCWFLFEVWRNRAEEPATP